MEDKSIRKGLNEDKVHPMKKRRKPFTWMYVLLGVLGLTILGESIALFSLSSRNRRLVENDNENRDSLLSSQLDSVSYLIGVNYGGWLVGNKFDEVDYDLMVLGIKDCFKTKGDVNNKQFKINPNLMNAVLDGYQQRRRIEITARNKEEGAAYIKKFLRQRKTDKTESGLCYKIVKPGSDKKAVSDMDTIWVDYKGRLLDESVFDENKNISFQLKTVIEGWREGMKLIGEGGQITLVIPSDLAYGDNGSRGIEPGSTLVFDVTLNKVGTYVPGSN